MKWAKGYDVGFLLSELSEAREVNGDGGYRVISGAKLRIIEAALSSAILDADVSRHLKAQAVHAAIASKQIMHQGEFAAAYQHAVRNLSSKVGPYIVAYPIWSDPGLLQGKFSTASGKVDLAPVKGRRWHIISEVRAEQRKSYERMFTTGLAYVDDYNLVLCFINALSPYGAQEAATETLSEFLGAVSLVEGRGRGPWTYNGFPQPISQVLIAPQITIHKLNGRFATDNFFFGSWNPKIHTPQTHTGEEVSAIRSDARRMFRAAMKSSWSKKAQLALRLYFDAVSEHDETSAFLAGWRVLEIIGGTPGTSYDVLVARAAKLYKNYDLHLTNGIHLKDQRNSITHRGQQTSTGRHSLAFQMKSFLEPLLILYVVNYMKFENEDDLWRFCDLSRDVGVRARNERLLKQAKIFFDRN